MRKYVPEILLGEAQNPEAWVIFSGETDIPYLKILKSGFRHCFILLNDGQHWMSIDPLSPYMDIQIYHHIESEFRLPQWLQARGYKAIKAKINKQHKKPAPWMFCTCVESIKRILGIYNRYIVTPWQLYRHLANYNHSEISKKSKGGFSWAV